MTVRDVYEATLVEINKENAQSFTVEEFEYILNKSILAFVNEKYNFYAANQQLSDDLRVLVKTNKFNVNDTDTSITGAPASAVIYNPTSSYVMTTTSSGPNIPLSSVKDLKATDVIRFGDDDTDYTISSVIPGEIAVTPSVSTPIPAGTVVKILAADQEVDKTFISNRIVNVTLPASDYLHLLSCRTMWFTKKPSETTVNTIMFTAKRLTFDMAGAVENNTYLKPAAYRPYHQGFNNSLNSGATFFPSSLSDYKDYQNKPVIAVHVGKALSYMELAMVEFNYLKIPEFVSVRDEDIFTAGSDVSQVLQFPSGLKNEIVKRCALYLLEKSSDQRLQTQPLVNQEIPTVPMNLQGTNQQQQTRAINAQQEQQ